MDRTKISIESIPLLFTLRNLEHPTVSPKRVQVEPCAENDDIKHHRYYQEIYDPRLEKRVVQNKMAGYAQNGSMSW